MNNLSFILIKRIISFIDSNVDKICFILTSNTFYKQRNKLLTFNSCEIKSSLSFLQLHIQLNSFKSIFIETFQIKNDHSCILLKDKSSANYNAIYNYIYYINDKYDIKRITNTISSFHFQPDFTLNKSYSLKDIVPTSATQLKLPNLPSDLKIDTIPSNIISCSLGVNLNLVITPTLFNEGLVNLHMTNLFNSTIEPGTLPSTLRQLDLGEKFNRVIMPNSLPLGLEILHLGNEFNKPIHPHSLPETLQTLKFGFRYDHPFDINSLPSNLKNLYLGYHYNFEFDEGVLPKGLVILEFGIYFNKPFKAGILPSTLKRLKLSFSYNLELQKDSLPDGIESIVFGWEYCKPFPPKYLPELRELYLIAETTVDYSLLPNLSKLHVPTYNTSIPNRITNLSINSTKNFPYNHTIEIADSDDSYIHIEMLPTSWKPILEHNSIFNNNSNNAIRLSNNLNTFKVKSVSGLLNDMSFPFGVEKLVIGNFHTGLFQAIPKSVKYLQIDHIPTNLDRTDEFKLDKLVSHVRTIKMMFPSTKYTNYCTIHIRPIGPDLFLILDGFFRGGCMNKTKANQFITAIIDEICEAEIPDHEYLSYYPYYDDDDDMSSNDENYSDDSSG